MREIKLFINSSYIIFLFVKTEDYHFGENFGKVCEHSCAGENPQLCLGCFH